MTKNKKFTGVFPPIITVFNDDESLNLESYKEHIDWLIENGADGIIVGGSTGEFFNMTIDECKKLIDVTIEHVNDKVPVLAGTADCSTRMTIELSKYAEDAGADGVLIVTTILL